jgi:hypothetical protein
MSSSDCRSYRRRRAATITSAVLMLLAACDTPTGPSADIIGGWDFTFSAFDQRSCPGSPGLVRGCAGSGRLDFLAATPAVDATHSYRASCQSCERALDYGVGEQPLRTARITGDVLEFSLAACRFTATLPDTRVQTLVGTAVCTLDQPLGAEIAGSWSISRR